ncbi:MAG: glycosyltransferase [Cyanomargarita calcarea GSE-NOS-MK-12-04C]|jgi:glycosyltransferase involved in cell wall biosynthesis|uniref:Glycosyltransferase n=1 Tax=Cyanomargarita calcarea GSE-NOS-MK-12-04C TaxID=2839659 RepID=A0A951QS73_9CYAN|nr:glycosyltransferase [Cyanomargarita calcarea GSE-NOS-MK-12-04C]
MKVLHVIASIAPVRGGPSQAVLEMVKAQRDCGIDASIATTNDNGPNLLDVTLLKPTEYQQVPVWFFPRFSPSLHPVREFAFSFKFTAWLWQEIHQYDLLHVHAIFSYPSTVAMAIARRKKVPYIAQPHGLLCEWSLQQSTGRKELFFKLFEQANLNHSKYIQFTTQQEQKETSRLNLSCPNLVIPLGLSISPTINNARQRLREYLEVPADEPIILFLSRFHHKKGLDYLIPALGKLSDKRFTFVLAGSGSPDYEAEVESLLVTHGIRQRTHLVGFVKGENKDLLLQGADLFALTSHSENFGVSVLEALAAGIPALLTPGVALAKMVEQQDVGYVTQLNVDAIASKLRQVLENPQQAKNMGDRARQLLNEKYTWTQIASQMQQVYQDILPNNYSAQKGES